MALASTLQPAPHITVCIRVRPQNTSETGSERVIEVIDEQSLVFDPWHLSKDTHKRGVPTTHRAKNITYAFDHVFDEHASQDEVYKGSTEGIISSVLDGYNATVFAYGSTGSGKTYTMMGNDRVGPGVMGLAMQELWTKINGMKEEFECEVSVSCLEVYNETLRDLFVQDSPALDMWEDPAGHASVSKLSVQHPSSVEEVQRLLAEANSRRRQSPTDANAESSRSHAVFQITVTRKAKAAGVNSQLFVGKLSLIDLAGSERAAKTNNRQERLQEGANINKSLLALANCINALGQGYRSGQHIPFRNSKLTRLLKDSLGGSCRTTMIANVSPSMLSYEDTLNSLKYANRTKNIKINASRKVINVRAHLGQYKEMIESLNLQVSQLRSRLKEMEASRANCTCLANAQNVVGLLDRLRGLFNEKASLFKQLAVIEKRIISLANAVQQSGKDDPVIKQSQQQRELILNSLTANDRGISRLVTEVDQLSPEVKSAIQRDVTGISFDAQVSQNMYSQYRTDLAVSILRDISATGLLPTDHPISARIRSFMLSEVNIPQLLGSPTQRRALDLQSMMAIQSQHSSSPSRLSSTTRLLSETTTTTTTTAIANSGPRTPLHIVRPGSANMLSLQQINERPQSPIQNGATTTTSPAQTPTRLVSSVTQQDVSNNNNTVNSTPKRTLQISRPSRQAPPPPIVTQTPSKMDIEMMMPAPLPPNVPVTIAPVPQRRWVDMVQEIMPQQNHNTNREPLTIGSLELDEPEFRAPIAPARKIQKTEDPNGNTVTFAPLPPSFVPPTGRPIKSSLKTKSVSEQSLESTKGVTFAEMPSPPKPRVVTRPTVGFVATSLRSPRPSPSQSISFGSSALSTISGRSSLISTAINNNSTINISNNTTTTSTKQPSAFSVATLSSLRTLPTSNPNAVALTTSTNASLPRYAQPKQQQLTHENENPNTPKQQPLLPSKTRWTTTSHMKSQQPSASQIQQQQQPQFRP